MGLKYEFRELFYKRILRPKRLFILLKNLDARITTLEEKVQVLENKP